MRKGPSLAFNEISLRGTPRIVFLAVSQKID